MECFDSYRYDCLPDEIVAKIFSYLPLRDCSNAAFTCTSWNKVFNSPLCWQSVVFKFDQKSDKRWLHYIQSYGHHIRCLTIEVEQSQPLNRENAISALKIFSEIRLQRLQYLNIVCIGENPLFYAGKELVDAVEAVFVTSDENVKSALKHVDLSHFPMLFDDSLVYKLSECHQNLEYLDIQNEPYVCKVSPACILRLIQKCPKLKDLRLMKCSLSEDVLLALADNRNCVLEHLSIKCRSEEKYMNNIYYGIEQLPSNLWAKLVQSLPGLRVTLHFDKTCPLRMILVVMKPEIPCSVLRLQTYTMLHEQVEFAANYYCDTLEKVVLDTHPSKELNSAVLELSRKCTKLKELYIYCSLEQATIEQVLHDHPEMKGKGSFRLQSSPRIFTR